MHWPQVIMIIFLTVGVVHTMSEHGRPSTQNGWTSLIGTLIYVFIMWKGGFWN